ncbi:hypothetical protein [Ponticaulis profundi]|uniref:Uncharacterized protein n=1 Tax=Ponticaulis profundi TaxID=2665222 RepID=A0ABW1S746_9PROT
MLHPSTRKLIDKLYEMTEAAKITWAEGDADTCIYDTEGYRVTIGQTPTHLVLSDAGGRILETVTESMLKNVRTGLGETYALKVDDLVSIARRQITGSEDIINKIVSSLDSGADDAEGERDYFRYDERQRELFPGQSEMTNRVAALAEKVNAQSGVVGTAPPEETDTSADKTTEEDFGTGWDVPEKAKPSGEDAAASSEEDISEAAPTFGDIGHFGAPAQSADEKAPKVDVPKPVYLDPVAYDAPAWGGPPRLIDAMTATPKHLLTPDHAVDEVETTSLPESFKQAAVSEATAGELDNDEAEYLDIGVEDMPDDLADEIAWKSGTPYVTGQTRKPRKVKQKSSLPDEARGGGHFVTPDKDISSDAEVLEEPEDEPVDEWSFRRTVYKFNPWM